MAGVVRTRKAVRLGFHRIKGFSQDDANLLVEKRGEGYRSVRDLWLRSGLTRAAIERLADADAFRSIGLDRRAALWAVRALDEKTAAERLPLFEKSGDDLLEHEADVRLPAMPAGEHVIHDYKTMSHSLKAHPLSFLRRDFARMGIIPTAALASESMKNGRRVTIAGLVLVRQRPGSAKGVIFMTLEDETGIANAIVWQKVFGVYRPVVMGSRLVSVRGKVQKAGDVIHVVAEHIENLTGHLSKLVLEDPAIPTLSPADEIRRPSMDHREKTRQDSRKMLELKEEIRNQSEMASDVMPAGRNFH
jgi:error-prone DNA polymerase